MSTLTKVELTQANTALAQDNMALRARVAQLEGDIERRLAQLGRVQEQVLLLEEKLLNVTSVASAVNKASTPRWQVERAEAMRIAKGMAMAARMVVKV